METEDRAEETSAAVTAQISAEDRAALMQTAAVQDVRLLPVTEMSAEEDLPMARMVRTDREAVTAAAVREDPALAATVVPAREQAPSDVPARAERAEHPAAALAARTMLRRRNSVRRTSAAIRTVLQETVTTRRMLHSSRTSSARERIAPAALSSRLQRKSRHRKSRSR